MANPLRKIFRNFRPKRRPEYPHTFDDMSALMFGKGSWREDQAMKLSAVYRCVTCITDSVAQLPLEIYKVDAQGYKKKLRSHPLFQVLNSKPNARMTRFIFIQRLVESILLEGNAYAYIHRDEQGNPLQLIYIPSGYVTINYPPTLDQPVTYTVSGEGVNGEWSQIIEASDMIHIVNHTDDGVNGISTLTFAMQTLGIADSAERHASNFFRSGCGVGGILKSAVRVQDEQKKEIKKAWDKVFNNNGGNSNGVVVLGAELDYQPVTVNARDAQLLESRAFNVIDICRFFGVNPVKAFDLSHSSYSTVEATNLSFLTDTLAPLLEKIELEFETKLFEPKDSTEVRFDVSQILRADKSSLASYYSTMFAIGAISPNEIRREIDLDRVEDGDHNFVQVNLQTLGNAANATQSGTEDEGTSQQQPI